MTEPKSWITDVDVVSYDGSKGYVVLERIHSHRKPVYCVHGETFCVRCDKAVWLGSETVKAVKEGVAPLCVQCATEAIPRDSQEPVNHIQDHLREDGPHED